ncbi:transcriptional regulator [Salmonella enterica subsp. salamae]|nr:transcriptional regulator [Salmonella enterica subsp. salamae]
MSPKNRKSALIPRQHWPERQTALLNGTLQIWFYPQ